MSEKNTVDVIIDGKIVRVSGTESKGYLVSVSNYLNTKITSFKKEFHNYRLLDEDLRSILLEINICDDLFQEQEKTEKIEKEKEELEKEIYSLKHDLVKTQMKLDGVLQELEKAQKKLIDSAEKEGKRGGE